MQLRTEIPISKERSLIDYDSKLVLLGSCFSDNIGEKLAYFKFNSLVNPFGILFHPIAIENFILNSINEKQFSDKDVFCHNEIWHSFETHSVLSSSSKNELLASINSAVKHSNKQLQEATHIIITLGTSWVYRYIETDTIVANCHKIPQKKFSKELLTINEITESLDATISLIKSLQKDVSIIFTLSPIRHLKNGFIENKLSKAHLLSAIHEVTDPKDKIHYFPSYEIMMDELRDYRFYAEDMIHPNATAIQYIWERFRDTWMSDNAVKIMGEVNSIQKDLTHKPFNPDSKQHAEFLDSIDAKIRHLQTTLPKINFT
ncbi:MAG: GSCFA domain-containing protein [Aureibaculum sp.]|nr:GSCFA domain-containing protein [Aureibaculum sp.]